MQGHPEFDLEFLKSRIEARKELLGESVYQAAINSLEQPTDAKTVGRWIADFLINEY